MRLVLVIAVLALGCSAQAQNDELCDAARRGARDEVVRLVATGMSLEVEYQDQTPLMWAAKMGHPEIVADLLASGAEVDHRSERGWTALAYASWSGETDIVRGLLEHGATVGPGPRGYGTELHLAAERGSRELVELLAPHVGDVDATVPERRNRTALMIAAEHGSTDVVQSLLAAGASPTKRTPDGDTAAHFAAVYGRLETLRVLLERAPELLTDTGNLTGRTPLALAAQFGHAEVVAELVAHFGGRPWAPQELLVLEDRWGWTPLHLAAASGSRDTARAVLHRTALEARTDLGRTPLAIAAHAKDGAMMTFLLGFDARSDVRDRFGLTPLELWREAGAVESRLLGALPPSSVPAPGIDPRGTATLELELESFDGGLFFRHRLPLVVWSDGVVLFDVGGALGALERRVSRVAPERLARLLAELDETGLFDGPPTSHWHPSAGEARITRSVTDASGPREVVRGWDGIDQSLTSEIDAEFRVFVRAFERAWSAAMIAVPAESWPLSSIAPDDTFRGIGLAR
ncbi:MAG: ankyrin repeat domain-containing protein [Planctomycetes bacterium]|nr:ankyrin repeat domain-containing protein [Planctomycetota bacterium]